MKKIKFLRDAHYPQADPAQSKEYKSGEVYDLEDDHANRWLRRGFAVEVKPEAKAEAKAAPTRAQAMVPNPPERA